MENFTYYSFLDKNYDNVWNFITMLQTDIVHQNKYSSAIIYFPQAEFFS